MPLVEIHARLANSVVLFLVVVGLWALVNYARRQGLSSSYWGTLVIGELLLAGQAVVGAVLYAQGGRPPRLVHYLYGVFILLVWPGIFAFTQGRSGRREALIYGVASLFMVGVAIRSISTGTP